MLVDEGGASAAVRSAKIQQALMQLGYEWDDIRRLREMWPDQLIIKGILHPEDAEQAVRLGVDGVLVSNHGERQLDSATASLDALVAIVDHVGDRIPIYLDGGVRTGNDVLKALALGATAVGIGRPYLYGLASGGQKGVRHILEILREEIVRTLTLMGVSNIANLERRQVFSRVGTDTPYRP